MSSTQEAVIPTEEEVVAPSTATVELERQASEETVVATPCCGLDEIVTQFNVDVLREAVEYLALLPDIRMNPSAIMAHLRKYGMDVDSRPGAASPDEDWTRFRRVVLQHINGTYCKCNLSIYW